MPFENDKINDWIVARLDKLEKLVSETKDSINRMEQRVIIIGGIVAFVVTMFTILYIVRNFT